MNPNAGQRKPENIDNADGQAAAYRVLIMAGPLKV
jgi:hypothetical protein